MLCRGSNPQGRLAAQSFRVSARSWTFPSPSTPPATSTRPTCNSASRITLAGRFLHCFGSIERGRFLHFFSSIEKQAQKTSRCELCAPSPGRAILGPCLPETDLAGSEVDIFFTGSPCNPFSQARKTVCRRECGDTSIVFSDIGGSAEASQPVRAKEDRAGTGVGVHDAYREGIHRDTKALRL